MTKHDKKKAHAAFSAAPFYLFHMLVHISTVQFHDVYQSTIEQVCLSHCPMQKLGAGGIEKHHSMLSALQDLAPFSGCVGAKELQRHHRDCVQQPNEPPVDKAPISFCNFLVDLLRESRFFCFEFFVSLPDVEAPPRPAPSSSSSSGRCYDKIKWRRSAGAAAQMIWSSTVVSCHVVMGRRRTYSVCTVGDQGP